MINATDANFAEVAIDRSRQVPVVVDLWAEWCGPCKTLGPIIEKVVAETEGRVELVKVDVDANPAISDAFQVKSIPAVFALSDGKVVDQFIGALPEEQVRAFVESLIVPSEADILLSNGDEPSIRRALELEPSRTDIVAALVTLLLDEGRVDDALGELARFPEAGELAHLAARARLAKAGVDLSGDVDARLDDLLERAASDDEARRELIDLLDALGAEDPRVGRYRRALASRLF